MTSPGRLAVFTQSELDTQAVFLADDCTEVDAPPHIYEALADQEIATGDTATVFVYISDDRGDKHTVSAESDNADVATVAVTGATAADPGWFRAGERDTAALRIAARAEGTASVRVTVTDEHGSSHSTSPFTVTVTSPALAAPTVETGSAAGELKVSFTATFDPMATRAYDYEVRRKRPQTPWTGGVGHRYTNDSDNVVTAPAGLTFSGLLAGVSFEVRYRDRGSSFCYDGTPGGWSAVGEGASRAQAHAFELDADNRASAGIVAANGLLYVLDDVDDKVYAYTTTGGRDADSDFDLDAGNGQPEGIAQANGRLYVADDTDGKIYAYRLSGARAAVADFDLDADNSIPGGIAHAGGRFFVADWSDAPVYAYMASGERDKDFDFDLHADHRRPEAAAYAAGSFYVVDDATDRIFVYAEDGGGAASRLSFPEGIATSRAIAENILPGSMSALPCPRMATRASPTPSTAPTPAASTCFRRRGRFARRTASPTITRRRTATSSRSARSMTTATARAST